MSIPGTSTRRPVAVAMLYLGVALLGVIAFLRLPIDLLPDVSYPRLVIYTSYPDVAPAEVERLVTERIERQAIAVPEVERVSSISRDGESLITMRFGWGADMDFAMLNTREKLDQISETLPSTAERPIILRVDPESDPIMVLSIAGGGGLWKTKDVAERIIRRRLEQLDGVAQAAVTGGLDREIHVEWDPALMESYGLNQGDVSNALQRANVSQPGGTILRGRYRYPLRTLGEFQSVEEIQEVVIRRVQSQGDSLFRSIRVRDVAKVTDGYADRQSIARYNGVESVGLLVFKESGANTVAVAEEVGVVLDQLRGENPDIQIEIASSQASFISESISNVVQALVFGGFLAFLVLFLFLRDTRYPVAVALAIPISVVGTFALMQAFGVSMNIMSLGGLALGVGMLVDNSIVVLENIFRHREEEGRSGLEAAAIGAEEVQGAITASTLTTISVFGPIIYVEGVAGELFGDLSMAVAFSLLVSLVVALTLLPAQAGRFQGVKDAVSDRLAGGTAAVDRPSGWWGWVGWSLIWIIKFPFWFVMNLLSFLWQIVLLWWGFIRPVGARLFTPLFNAFDRVFDRFARRYHRVLEWSLDHRGRVVAIALLTLGGTGALAMSLDRDLLPNVDQGAFDVRLDLVEGTSLAATAEAGARIESGLLEDPGVAVVFSRIGRDIRAYAQGDAEGTGLHQGYFQVRLKEGVKTDEVLERVRPLAGHIASLFPEAIVTFETGQATGLGKILGGTDADIAIRILGENLDSSFAYADEVQRSLAGSQRLGNVRTDVEEGQPQLWLQIKEDEAAQFGIEPRAIATTIGTAMRGDIPTTFVAFDRKINIVVRLSDEMRYSESTLRELRVQGIPLRELVTIEESMGPAEIHRRDQGRVVTVYADVVSGGLASAIAEVDERIDDLTVPKDHRVVVGGENEEMRRSFRDLVFAFALALLLVYMILAAQFESFIHPFTILIAVPLALIGAVLALAVAGEGLNTMSLIGVVILVGIVVNDSIIKVDFINQARAAGRELRSAILEAGRVRLRPIVMTTVTTVLGLTPMALGIGTGSDLRAPLAIAVIGGLIVATGLTLIVVPVVYSAVEGIRLRIRGPSPVGTSASGPTTAIPAPEQGD